MVNTVRLSSVFLLLVALAVDGGPTDESPSLASLRGKEITPSVAGSLPRRDCSSPQKAFLGFLKSSVEGNLRDYVFYMTPEARKAIAGVEEEDAISDARAQDFTEAFGKARFQKIKLESFQAVPDVSPTQIVAVVASSRGKMEMRDRYEISVVQTNGQWKFSAVNVSVIDRRPTNK